MDAVLYVSWKRWSTCHGGLQRGVTPEVASVSCIPSMVVTALVPPARVRLHSLLLSEETVVEESEEDVESSLEDEEVDQLRCRLQW